MEKDGWGARGASVDAAKRNAVAFTGLQSPGCKEREAWIERELREFKTELAACQASAHVRVKVLLDTIHDNLFNPCLTVAWLRSSCRIRDHNASSEFLHVVGRTIKAYITFRRMEMAARLLLHRELPVSAVAHRVGFIHVQTFHCAFRGHFGVSPRRFGSQ